MNRLIPIIIVLIFAFSCKQSIENKKEIKSDSLDLKSQIKDSVIQNKEVADLSDAETGCVRGIPEPVLMPEFKKNSTFVLSQDKITGTENIILPNGDSLTIFNTGCEYYVIKIRLITKNNFVKESNLKNAYLKLNDLVGNLKNVIDAPIDIETCVKYLPKYIEKTNTLSFGEQIDYGDSEIRNFLIFENFKTYEDRIEYNFSFNVGPL